MRIEKWFINRVADGTSIIYGFVYDNPQFENGTYIHTSKIVDIDKNFKWVRTMNSTYELGGKGNGREYFRNI